MANTAIGCEIKKRKRNKREREEEKGGQYGSNVQKFNNFNRVKY